MPMRWAVYAGVSTALATGVVLKALHQRANFYSACVYLAQSNANLMILTNFIFLILCALLLALQKLLYGPLRPIEIEQLYEKAWFAVTETCLAMTIFPRGELGGWFLVMFFSLLAGKVWAWIGEGRVEFLEQQPPSNPRLFHTRLATSLGISILFNTYLLEYSVKTVLRQARPDMMVMFGFEFAVLSITSISTAARYWISLMEIYIIRKQKQEIIEERRQEIRRQRDANNATEAGPILTNPSANEEEIDEMELDVPGWEEKGRWVFYLDLLTDFLKLNVYLAFFTILLTFYGLPIHIIRDVFFTCRSFINRIKDFIRYRTATRDMNDRYPDATAEEVSGADVCIICREEMTAWPPPADTNTANPETETRRRMRNSAAERMRPKKLPCGHVLHFSCLRSWLERQQNCPTCRRPVLAERRLPGTGVGAAAGADGHLPGQEQDDGANDGNIQNRARIINLGPLRIGFGAGRGNLFNDLAQQVQNGQARPADGAAGNGIGPQQYGFGLGWNRNQAQENRPAAPSGDIPSQIRALEHQLQQEINGLRVAADQLHTIRAMQGELARLRMVNANGGSTGANAAIPVGGSRYTHFYSTPRSFPPSSQWYTAGAQSTTIPAGSSQLPPGLVLPEGWSMLPLQRNEGNQQTPSGVLPHATQLGTSQAPTSNISIGPDATRTDTSASASSTHPAPTHVQDPQVLPTPPGIESSSINVPVTEVPVLPESQENTSTTLNGNESNGVTPDVPLSTPDIPSWGSDSAAVPEGQALNEEQTTSHVPSSDEEDKTPSSSPEASGNDKGKAKAATVEDFIEDVD